MSEILSVSIVKGIRMNKHLQRNWIQVLLFSFYFTDKRIDYKVQDWKTNLFCWKTLWTNWSIFFRIPVLTKPTLHYLLYRDYTYYTDYTNFLEIIFDLYVWIHWAFKMMTPKVTPWMNLTYEIISLFQLIA